MQLDHRVCRHLSLKVHFNLAVAAAKQKAMLTQWHPFKSTRLNEINSPQRTVSTLCDPSITDDVCHCFLYLYFTVYEKCVCVFFLFF